MDKRKSKILSLAIVFAFAFTALVARTPATVQAATVKSGKVAVTVPKTTLYVGDSKNNKIPITVTYNNKKVTKGIKYGTSNRKAATVKSGKIVAVKKGTATISVKYKGKTCKAKITVKNAKLTLNKNKLNLKKGKIYMLTAYANGTKVKAASIKWTSSNKKVVSVNKKGVIKGLKNGKATITAQTSYGRVTCIVTINITHVHNWVTTKEPVTKWQLQCLGCGQWFDSEDELSIHVFWYPVNDDCGAEDPNCSREVVITPGIKTCTECGATEQLYHIGDVIQ